jgi:DegV family protein with EDD domain
MSKVAIVTDSTAYMPAELVNKYQIQVAPQVLIWGNETFRDGVDIQSTEFFARLKTAKQLPTTSQVNPRTFFDLFKKLTEEDYQILAILLSTQLSKTIDSAEQAHEMLPDATVEIVDSHTTSMAMGFVVLAAARAVEAGANLTEARAVAEHARGNVGVVFAVDTLEFLHRGGRIGGANRFLGTALNIKPILEVTGGRVEAIERVRTRSKSLSRVIEIVAERSAGRPPLRLATLHANAADDARLLLDEASKTLNPVETYLTEVSPVVANHAGPGTVGLAFMAGE